MTIRFVRRTVAMAAFAVFMMATLADAAALGKQAVAHGRGGAVASISAPASAAALEILDVGGNAIDAAVAAAAVLGVTDPFNCGIGGGGFMLVWLADEGRAVALDHRETAPAQADSMLFQTADGPMKHPDAVLSGRSVGVPGTVRGWHEALARYGSLPLARVLAPAIRVADEGFVVDENFHRLNAASAAKLAHFSSSAALYLHEGKALPVGSLHRNPDLAQTYRELARDGVRAFYEGITAARIVAAVNFPPTVAGVEVPGGRLTMADLADYEARVRAPVRSSYRGWEVLGMPPPSAGGIFIAQALNLLENFELSHVSRTEVEHLYLEASRLAFADRDAYVADPEFVDLPVQGLLSKAYARARATAIGRARAPAGAVPPGDPFRFQRDGSVPLRPQAQPLAEEAMHTTHLTVADRDGNVVSYTFTIEAWGGNGIVVPGRGFLLNNELTDFDFSGPHPNLPEARKRPRSSMAPTIVLRDGKPVFALGSPGGPTILTTVLQILVNHLDLGMDASAALEAPRMSQRNGADTLVESFAGFPDSAAAEALVARGHRWQVRDQIGAASAIVWHADGSLSAVSEQRRSGGGSALAQPH